MRAGRLPTTDPKERKARARLANQTGQDQQAAQQDRDKPTGSDLQRWGRAVQPQRWEKPQ